MKISSCCTWTRDVIALFITPSFCFFFCFLFLHQKSGCYTLEALFFYSGLGIHMKNDVFHQNCSSSIAFSSVWNKASTNTARLFNNVFFFFLHLVPVMSPPNARFSAFLVLRLLLNSGQRCSVVCSVMSKAKGFNDSVRYKIHAGRSSGSTRPLLFLYFNHTLSGLEKSISAVIGPSAP